MTRQQFLDLPPGYSEDKLQAAAHTYLNHNYLHYYGLFFSIPNGGTRHHLEAFKFKATGLTAGIPDYMLISPATGKFNPVEFKLPNTKLTGNQPRIHKVWGQYGVFIHIVRTPIEFLTIVDSIFTTLK